jgi:hypothetical protein
MIENAQKMNQLTDVSSSGADFFIKLFNLKLFMNKTVHELVSGYDDPLMTLAKLTKLSSSDLTKKDKFSIVSSVR